MSSLLLSSIFASFFPLKAIKKQKFNAHIIHIHCMSVKGKHIFRFPKKKTFSPFLLIAKIKNHKKLLNL